MPLIVVLALLLVPIAEIFVIVQVADVIGGWPTVALLIADSVLGAWLVRREGRRAWVALRTSLTDVRQPHSAGSARGAGRVPARELADGALILVGGTLLLTPGFLSDALGFFLVLPFTRPLARRALIAFATRWFLGKATLGRGPRRIPPVAPGAGSGPPRDMPRAQRGRVVSGEVVEEDPGPGPPPRK